MPQKGDFYIVIILGPDERLIEAVHHGGCEGVFYIRPVQ
jgi:hypothetical protein